MLFSLVVRDDAKSLEAAKKLQAMLEERGGIYDESNPTYVIFIGGDGTFLRAIHQYAKNLHQIKFVGINLGTLGFFCNYQDGDMLQLVDDLCDNRLLEEHMPLLEANLTGEQKHTTILALNEIRIENPFHTLITQVEIDGDLLENYRGNGLVVSSSLGSTAYNKSLGGAVIMSPLNIIQLTEIAAIQNNAFRSLGSSLILEGTSKIALKGKFNKIVIGYDHLVFQVDDYDKIIISSSETMVNLLRRPNYSYIKTLNATFIK